MRLLLVQYIDRSGSSFLVNQLSNMKGVYVFPEAGYLGGVLLSKPLIIFSSHCNLYKKLRKDFSNHFQLKKWNLNFFFKRSSFGKTYIDLFCEMLKENLNNYRAEDFLVFKVQYSPAINKKIREIQSRFVEFKIVYLIRDPRAIYNSILIVNRLKLGLPFNINPLILCIKWNYLMQEYSLRSNNSCAHFILYEELIRNNEWNLEQIITFLNLTDMKSAELNAYYNNLTEREKIIHSGITYSPDISSIDKWTTQLNPVLVDLIEYECFKNMKISTLYYPKKGGGYVCIVFARRILLLYYKLRIIFRIDHF